MNSFQSISGDSENSSVTRRGVSRRSVMKAGAAAAWSVPLVQVVAAAPAVAVSGTKTQLSWTALTGSYSDTDARNLNVSASISNTGSIDATAVQVVLTIPVAGATVAAPTGWSVTPSGQDFTFTKQTPLGASSTATLAATFTLPTLAGAGITVTGSAGAGNADFVSTSVAVQAAKQSTVVVVGPGSATNPTQNFANKVLTITAAVKNNGPRTVRSIALTVSLPRDAEGSTVTSTDSNWSTSPAGLARAYTLTYRGDVLPGGRTSDANVRISFGANNTATATFQATATSV